MKKQSIKALGTVVAVCLCATACGSTASNTTENAASSETKEISAEQPAAAQSQEAAAEVSENAQEVSTDNFTVTYLEDGTVMLSDYKGDAESIIVPSDVNGKSVTVINSSTFQNHEELISVTLPDTIKKIDDKAFFNCSNLERINLGTSLESIGRYGLACTAIKEIQLPDTLITLDYQAFAECKFFNVEIPTSVTEIGNATFIATDIQTIKIPFNITEIKGDMFRDCRMLTEVTMEDGVEVIGESAFEGCDVLEKVTLSSTVTEICKSAFKDCLALSYIYIPDSVTEIEVHAFWNSENVTIYTPAGSYAESFAMENDIPYVNQ